jgi:arginyl-tRNA synthetase
MNFKELIVNLLVEKIPLSTVEIEAKLEQPPKEMKADWGFPCFILAKIKKQAPPVIAKTLAEELKTLQKFPGKIEAVGPYVNFQIDPTAKAKIILSEIWINRKDFGSRLINSPLKQTKSIVVEFPSPNTNKPLHLGHVRNMLIGQATTKINAYVGHNVHPVNLCNDRGVHICKSMLAYQLWGQNDSPESSNMKSDHFVGKYYVKYAIEAEKKKEELENQTQAMLRQWEENNPEVRNLWKKMNDWALKGFAQTFKAYGIVHEKTYYESEIYWRGKEIVLDGLRQGVFDKLPDGAVVINFPPEKQKEGFPEQKVLLRRDGTALYITQDLYLAYAKMNDFHYNKSIYVIGNEQNMQMRTVFEILRRLGMQAENVHMSHGMIDLPEGKMKSREGKVVDADDLRKGIIELARERILARDPNLSKDEQDFRALRIGMAALRFFILKYDYKVNFTFNPEQSLEFEGETGPYILYTYTRTKSIFKKADFDPFTQITDINQIKIEVFQEPAEIELINYLGRFQEVVIDAAENFTLHLLAKYLLEMSQKFNDFYRDCRVIQEDKNIEHARLFLIACYAIVIQTGLSLLSIETLDEM